MRRRSFLSPRADPATIRFARNLLVARRRRDEILNDYTFSDAEWSMLVDLFLAAEEGALLSLSSVYAIAPVSKATALRLIAGLVESGHLLRAHDPADGRRSFVQLSPETHVLLDKALSKMRRIIVDENGPKN